jgi:hypothetical protein
MNERIKELKDKIWTEEYWDTPNTDKLLPFQLNRFAELIVKECADFINSHEQVDKYGEAMDVVHGEDLLTHFGVEK